MQVRPDGTADTDSLVARLAVVPEARDDAPERLGARIQPRAPGMVLEAGDRSPLTGDELAFEQDVADHPLLAGHGLVWEEADPRHRVAVAAQVAAPEQLVAAADRQQRGAGGDRLRDRRPLGDEVGCDQRLLAVLPAAARRVSTAMFPRSA